MTVATAYSVISSSGNGVTTAFSVTWPFFAATDLVVTLVSSTGVETVKTLTTHYTVSGGTDVNGLPAVGTVTMLTAPASGETLRIQRSTSKVQSSSWTNGGSFQAKTVEATVDRLMLIAQEGTTGGGGGDGITGDVMQFVSSSTDPDYWDAENAIIRNVADPVADDDAVPKGYADATYGGALAAAAAASATSASASATSAASSATSASSSAASAAAAWDAFDDLYLGAKASDPLVDNDGAVLTSGVMYFNTVSDELRVYDGAAWVVGSPYPVTSVDGSVGAVVVSATKPVATRTALKALDTTKYTTAVLMESGREGAWVWTSGDYAARITADTTEAFYVKADAIATTAGAWVRAYGGHASVKWFGAKGDGSTDDTTALQAALDSNMVCIMPPGRYRITTALLIDPIRNRNCGFVGTVSPSYYPETTQSGGPDWSSGTKECVIWYDGATGATTAVLAISAEPVNTEPASTFATTILGVVLRNMVFDGNAKANYGVYGARLQDADIHNCVVYDTAGDGWYLNGIYSGKYSNLLARTTGGRGFGIGAARRDFGWTTNDGINGVTFIDLWALNIGYNGDFHETTSDTTRTKGCGIYFAPHRGAHIYRATCEITDGYGFVFEPTGACNTIQGAYTELNGDSLVVTGGAGVGQTAYDGGRATRANNGLCWLGDSGAGSMHNRVVDSWFAAGAIYVGGTAITASRKEGAVEFNNVAGGSVFETAHAMWRMVNCGEEYMAGVTGTASTGAMVLPAGIQFDKDGDTLSYFDEGTWTPTIGGSSTPGTPTYSAQVGKFQRIGKRVTFEGYVVITAISGSPAGTVRIGGLPLPSSNYRCAVHIPYWIGFTSGVAGGVIEPNTDYIDVYRYVVGSVAVLNATEISATSRLMISGSYEVA